jgi:hypothetical protein
MMKRLFKLNMILITFFGNHVFSQIPELRTGIYQVNCKSIQSDLIEIEIWATKKPSKYRIERACRDAINANLYLTISSNFCGSQTPLLSNSQEIQNFDKIKTAFFNDGTWRMYVRNSSVISQEKGRYLISIDRKGLRKYLFVNQIISNLNKGF